MPTINVLEGHELVDLVDEESLFDAADQNGIGITDTLTPGTLIIVTKIANSKLSNEIIAKAEKIIKVKAEAGQTWVDLTLQQLGDEERLFELADGNNAGITDDIPIGTEIVYPVVSLDKKKTAVILQANKPASETVVPPGTEKQEGIEYWTTEQDFIVS
jgi:hypothetical protein